MNSIEKYERVFLTPDQDPEVEFKVETRAPRKAKWESRFTLHDRVKAEFYFASINICYGYAKRLRRNGKTVREESS